jgi:16S rRNA (adenine1518-N6/adenine1519-N6)-dimethyltransferase
MPSDTLLARTKRMLNAYGLQARKSLGQHFLVDEDAVLQILKAAELTTKDTVIEVGPGLGVMTDQLAKNVGRVVAVELDDRLSEILTEKFANKGNVEIIHADILSTDLAALIGRTKSNDYKVVANLPYYITSAVIRYFLEAEIKPERLVLMTQKEVAEQITAQPGAMSLLSVSVQVYGKPQIISIVPAGSFYPPPNVDSAILKIDVYPRSHLGLKDIEGFFTIVKAGFSANRKQIINPLSHQLEMDRPEVLAILEKAGIDYHRRAETLTIEEWKRLFLQFFEKDL